ncbi:MAG: 4Fe-4S binding protein [Lentisphaeria bacterium]|nr:4Fe-4S binding protein [Lentisphaeria bacterium]
MPTEKQDQPRNQRRFFLRCLVGLAGTTVAGFAAKRATPQQTVWQIDPSKCTSCGKCATECVLAVSAVKCIHTFEMCGYCKLCFGYFESDAPALNSGAENQLCPTGAIQRHFIEEPYYEYTIDESLCIGCAKCVKGCNAWGNGSLHLQIKQDLCLHCNECTIARACPSNAIVRRPASRPYFDHAALTE